MRPGSFEVIEQRIAGLLRQWQADLPPSFAAYPKRPLIPVDVVETHAENIAAAQAETNQQKQDCLVANAMRLREVAAGDEPFDVSGRQIAWQRRESPLWDRRHRSIEPWATRVMRCQEPQIAPERCRHRLDVRTSASLGRRQDHPPDKRSALLPGIIPGAWTQPGEHPAVTVHCAL